MQKLLKKSKLLLMVLLVGGANLSCISKTPKPPVIKIYLHDVQAGKAYGSSSDGKHLSPVDIAGTDNWYMLPPSEWEKVQNYVDLLSCVIDGGCKSEDAFSSVSITAQDLKKISKKIKVLRENLEIQRTNNGNSEF